MKKETVYMVSEFKNNQIGQLIALCKTKKAVLEFLENGNPGSVKAEFSDTISDEDIYNKAVLRKIIKSSELTKLLGIPDFNDTEYYIIHTKDLLS